MSKTKTKDSLQKMVQGTVRHQGLPVQGIEVRLYNQNSTNSMAGQSPNDSPLMVVKTGPQGEFEFPCEEGTYSLQAIPRSDNRLLKSSIFDVNLENPSIKYNISLNPGILLSGKIRTKYGDSVTGGEVFALSIESSPYWTISPVDNNGRFTLVLPRGKFHIGSRSIASSPENKNKRRPFLYLNKQVHAIDLFNDKEVEFELPKLHKFQGSVKDPKDNPVVDAKMVFTPKDMEESPVYNEIDFFVDCLTDIDGKFEVNLEGGTYDLDLVPSHDSKQFGISESDIKVTANVEKNFILEEGHSLSGRIQFKEKPIKNCQVRIQSKEEDREFIAESDQSGEFRASIPPGIYKLTVFHELKNGDKDSNLELAPWTKEIVVGGDTHVSIKLKSGTVLSGAINDESGTPRQGIRVSVYAVTSENADELNSKNLGRPLSQTNTDKNGHYAFSLTKGKYWLVVHKDFESARKIEMDNESKVENINWHGWCQLSFLIEGEEGASVPRCKVIYKPYMTSAGDNDDDNCEAELPKGYVITDKDGRCQLTIPSGIYSFEFSPPQAGSYSKKEIRQLSIINDIKKTVNLTKKY